MSVPTLIVAAVCALQDRLAERSVQVLHSVQVDPSLGPGSPSGGAGSSSTGGATGLAFSEFSGSAAGADPQGSAGQQGRPYAPSQAQLSRVWGRGGRVVPVKDGVCDSAPGGVEGVQQGAGLAAVSAGGGRGRVAVPVLAEADGGSVELQQLLGEMAGMASSSRHAPQQASQQQQQQLHTAISSSRDAVVHQHLQQQSCRDSSFLAPPSVEGARHRSRSKQQGGLHRRGNSGGGSCGRALGEGAEESWSTPGWQPHMGAAVVTRKQGLVA